MDTLTSDELTAIAEIESEIQSLEREIKHKKWEIRTLKRSRYIDRDVEILRLIEEEHLPPKEIAQRYSISYGRVLSIRDKELHKRRWFALAGMTS